MKKTKSYEKSIQMGILLGIVFLVMGFCISFSSPNSPMHISTVKSSTLSGAITIYQDSDFLLYASEGDGTALNPYIIEDFVVDVSGTTDIGIIVSSTSAHFIIRNCTIFGSSDEVALGMYTIGSGTGTVENNTIISDQNCINFDNSDGVNIFGNNLSFSGDGVCLEFYGCDGTKILYNTLENDVLNGGGLDVTDSSNVTIMGNTIKSFGTGLGLNWDYGSAYKNAIVFDNRILNCSTGIYLERFIDSHLFGNIFTNSVGSDINYAENEFSNQAWIYENIFIDGGINLASGNYNQTIFHNVFEVGFWVIDHGIDNIWYNPDLMEGNNWPDWIGTGGYSIPGTAGSEDIYPNSTASAFLDADADGLTDDSENYTFSTVWNNNDTDFDGILDGQEVRMYLSNPKSDDTDGDLLPDGWEILYEGFNLLVPNDPNGDPDEDKLSNLQEVDAGTDPTNPDTDGDGADDGREVKKGTDPLDPNDTPFIIPGFSTTMIILISFIAIVVIYRKIKIT